MTPPRTGAFPEPALGAPSRSAAELLVFSDDWGRHPSSCQHLIRQMLPRHAVYWMNTIGTRPPRLDLLTFRRGMEKLQAWGRRTDPTTDTRATPTVLQPIMWPSFSSLLGRRLNRRLLARACRKLPPAATTRVAITTIPLVADLIGRTEVDRWVYYCVDDLSQWPGLDRKPLELMERRLVEKADCIIAVSDRLVERMHSLGRTAKLLTHGVDLEHWSTARPSGRLEGLSPPYVVFWGVVDRRLDMAVLEHLDRRLERGTLVLAGPENNPPRGLADLDRAAQLGPLPYDELPSLAHEAAVLIMPYADLPATRAMQPLKLKEYLATGKPVVTSPLPAVAEWSDACDVEATPEGFAERVVARATSGVPAAQLAARSRLANESWTQKAERFFDLALEPARDDA